MRDKYLASLRIHLLSRSTNLKELFFCLLNNFEIAELRKFPDFAQLKSSIVSPKLSPQELFEKIAISAVQKKKLNTLIFLMDECGYDLKETYDQDNRLTLLHEACLHGAREITAYLLQKGFNPNAKDDQGDTPLHQVVKQNGNAPLILLLSNHKASFNIKNKSGLTPLHLAVLKKFDAIPELIKQGASTKIKHKNWDYISFRKAVQQGEIRDNSPPVCLSNPQAETKDITAEYYKGCLLPHFNQQVFQTVKTGLIEKSDMLTKTECFNFIDALVLTGKFPFQPQLLINSLLSFIKKGKLTLSFALIGALHTARVFAEQKQVKIVDELNDLVLSQLNTGEILPEEASDIYYLLGFLYKKAGLFLKSVDCFRIALSRCSEKRSNENKAEMLFNLGCTQTFLMQRKEALLSFETAFHLNNNDIEIYQRYLTALVELGEDKKALQVCSDAKNFEEYSLIYTAYLHTLSGNLSWSDLLKIADATFSDPDAQILALSLKAYCHLKLYNYKQALLFAHQYLLLTEKNFEKNEGTNISAAIVKILYVYIQASEYVAGLELAKAREEKYPLEFGSSVLCNGALSVLYLANKQFDNAEKLINNLQSLGVDHIQLSNAYLLLAVDILSMEQDINYSAALHYVNLASEINPNNFLSQFYKLLIHILIGAQENVQEILKDMASDLAVDPSVIKNLLKESVFPENPIIDTSISVFSETDGDHEDENPIISEEQIEFEIEAYDPIKIHQFFQGEKARLLNESIATLSPTPQPKTKWKVGAVCFEEGVNGLTRIQYPRFPNCYAVIHPGLNPPFVERFQDALQKSNYYQTDLSDKVNKISRKRGSNVQTLNNSIVQLKIHANNRLWTDTVYHYDGKYLFVFSQHAYHAEVHKKAERRTEIKVIDLTEEKQLSSMNQGEFKSGFFASSSGSSESEEKTRTVVTPAQADIRLL